MASIGGATARDSEVRLPKTMKVKNKAAASRQITAEQILRESKEIQLEDDFKAPKTIITDPEELAEYRWVGRGADRPLEQLLLRPQNRASLTALAPCACGTAHVMYRALSTQCTAPCSWQPHGDSAGLWGVLWERGAAVHPTAAVNL